jgi:uncharacterized protein (TIGR02466 family)
MEKSYNFYYWGPLLFRTKLNKEDLNEVLKLCDKNFTNKINKELAGIIDEEYSIDLQKYFNIIKPYLDNVYKKAFETWYVKSFNQINIKSAWVNFMKNGEFNPPHTHINCILSSVLYLQIPEKLKIENKNYIGKSSGPGSISFTYGEERFLNINIINFFPEEGDFFIFPSNLQHVVFPFKSKVERISIASNFDIF